MLNVAIVGPGLVGGALLSQLASHLASPRFAALPIRVVGLLNSKKMATGTFSSEDLADWQTRLLGDSSEVSDLPRFISALSELPQPTAIVDCTSSDTVAAQYPQWLARGLHVVTPNKKAFSGPMSLYQEIQSLTQPRGPAVYHEATVGAGLPILSTLDDLVRTGDRIVRIEGIFSGTLSYLFNSFTADTKFSECVGEAKANGYTEPDPRDDLNGMDVARKVTILGRKAGMDLSVDTLDVENIVPESLRGVKTAEEFMERLPEFDGHFEKLNQEATKQDSVLRYVGVVEKGKSCVKLAKYPLEHPFASLKGSDNIVAFTTERFPIPLIVQGAGAGAEVTAFGVFSDLIKICERFN